MINHNEGIIIQSTGLVYKFTLSYENDQNPEIIEDICIIDKSNDNYF